MKKIFLITCLIILGYLSFSQSNSQLIDSAFNLYRNKDYESALKIYQDFYSQQYESADLFYNMGNCYMETNDLANAIYFYEKAKILNPNDENIDYNLKIANARIKDRVEAIPEIFYKLWFNNFCSFLSSDAWAIFAVITFCLALILFFIFLFSRKKSIKKLCFYFTILIIIFAIIGLICSYKSAKNINNNKFGIIFNSTMVKSAPNEDGTNLFEINEGLKVEIKDSVQQWKQIRLLDGKERWIIENNIKGL